MQSRCERESAPANTEFRMATAHLLIPSDDGGRLLAIDGSLPRLPVSEMLRAGELLGLDLAVTRTIARLDDDRVVLCEPLDDRTPAGAAWIESTRVADHATVNETVAAWRNGSLPRPHLLPWERDGWFRDVVTWVDRTLSARGIIRVGRPVQLRHWGLSAVLRVPTDKGHVIVKQVPAGLGAEGRATAWLSELLPGAVPVVYVVDDRQCRFVMQGVDAATRSEHEGVLSLAALQRASARRIEELELLGLPDRRPLELVAAARRLGGRDDLLFERGWALASTDTRRPPRPVTTEDVVALRRLLDEVEPVARRLEEEIPHGTVVHGDFHLGNVLRDGDRNVVIDWGMAAIGHPLFDLPAWPSWGEQSDDDLLPFLNEWRCSLDEWGVVRPLALLFHAATAAHIADSMPPGHRTTEWAAAVQKSVLRALMS